MMDLRHLFLMVAVIYTLRGHSAEGKRPKFKKKYEKANDFDEHLGRLLADLSSTTEDARKRPPVPSPSCLTYPRGSYAKPRKSVIRKRSRYKMSEQVREPGPRDILAQLDDEIEEQEMDKRSRIELLSYLDAAIKNKNIELNLEMAHLAKEEEMFNLKSQDNIGVDRTVLSMSSNIDELGKRIKDLDERIAQMNKLKEERANQENAIWRDTFEKSASYNLGGVKVGDNENRVAVDGKNVIGVPVSSRVKGGVPNIMVGAQNMIASPPNMIASAPNAIAGAPNMNAGSSNMIAGSPNMFAVAPNMIAGSPNMFAIAPNMIAGAPNMIAGAPHIIAGAPHMIAGAPNMIAGASHITASAPTVNPAAQAPNPDAASAIISSPMSGRYLGSKDFARLPEAQPWWPMWDTQQWNGMYNPQWPQFQDYKRLPPLYSFLPHPRSVPSDLEEYDD